MGEPMQPGHMSNDLLVGTMELLKGEVIRRWKESEKREQQLRAEVERLREEVSSRDKLLRRWRAAYPATHDILGFPLLKDSEAGGEDE